MPMFFSFMYNIALYIFSLFSFLVGRILWKHIRTVRYHMKQCCGSGSVCFGPPGSGSISTRYGSGSGSFYHQARIVRKILIPTVLWHFYDFLSLKNDVNVDSKSNKPKNWENFFLVAILKVTDENSRIGSRIRIRNRTVTRKDTRIRLKMTWIRNTDMKIIIKQSVVVRVVVLFGRLLYHSVCDKDKRLLAVPKPYINLQLCTMLRIRDVYSGSLDPDFFHSGSEFFPSRIRILAFYSSRIPGSKKHRIPDTDPQHWLCSNYDSLFAIIFYNLLFLSGATCLHLLQKWWTEPTLRTNTTWWNSATISCGATISASCSNSSPTTCTTCCATPTFAAFRSTSRESSRSRLPPPCSSSPRPRWKLSIVI